MRSAIRRVALFAAGLVGLASCATTASTPGEASLITAGSITSEIADIGLLSSIDNQRFRWSYVVVLRNAGSTSVELQQVETSYITQGAGDVIGGTPSSQPFRQHVGPNAELRVPVTDNWGWTYRTSLFGGASTLDTVTALRRYLGTDATGNPVAIPVRLQLHRGVGRRASPPRAPERLPAPSRLTASDMPRLAGKWRGSERASEDVFDIPLELTISKDGSFEAGVNDPVTTQFRGRLAISDGGVRLSAGNDSGPLHLYLANSKDMLAGTVSGPRAGGRTVTYAVYLERDATARPGP